MWPIIFTTNNQFCLYHPMRSGLSKCTDPPLTTRKRGGVYFKLLGFRDISGRRLKPSDIGAMTQFCLKIATKNSTVCDKWTKIPDELWGALGHHDWLECLICLSVQVDSSLEHFIHTEVVQTDRKVVVEAVDCEKDLLLCPSMDILQFVDMVDER